MQEKQQDTQKEKEIDAEAVAVAVAEPEETMICSRFKDTNIQFLYGLFCKYELDKHDLGPYTKVSRFRLFNSNSNYFPATIGYKPIFVTSRKGYAYVNYLFSVRCCSNNELFFSKKISRSLIKEDFELNNTFQLKLRIDRPFEECVCYKIEKLLIDGDDLICSRFPNDLAQYIREAGCHFHKSNCRFINEILFNNRENKTINKILNNRISSPRPSHPPAPLADHSK